MSTTTIADLSGAIHGSPANTSPRHARSVAPVTFARVVRSEWIKLRSLRSTWWTLGAAALAVVGLAIVIGYVSRNAGPSDNVGRPGSGGLAPSTVLSGSSLGQLLVGVLGVLFVASEYTTGMIRSTMTAVPRRTTVVVAKLTVFSAVTFTTMLVTSLVAFFAGNAVLAHYGKGFSITDDTSLRVIVATAAYLTLLGALGTALGWILRSTASALATLFALLLVVPVILQALGSTGTDIAPYLPSNAGTSFASSIQATGMLGMWSGLAVLLAWVAAALAAAVLLLRRRDV